MPRSPHLTSRRGGSTPLLALLLLLFVVASGAGTARADSSDLAVAYQVNVAHSGVQTDLSIKPPLQRRWAVTLPATVSYPLIAEGMVFVTTGDTSTDVKTLYALDQATGHVVWSQPLPFNWSWSNAAYDNGRIFVVGNVAFSNGLMLTFTAATGELVWTTQLTGAVEVDSPPTAANGVVYTGGIEEEVGGTLYAVRESDGQILATSSPVLIGDHSSPALSDNGVFVAYACNQDYGFAQTTLASFWHDSGICYGGGGKTPVYAGGRLYTRDFTGDLVLDATTGALIRNYGPPFGGGFAPAVDEHGIYQTFIGQYLAAQSLDGTPLWSFAGDGGLDTAPVLVNTRIGRLIFVGSGATASGHLFAVDADTGAEVWSADVGAPASPPDEQNVSKPLTGLGVGQGLVVVPAGNMLVAFFTDSTPPVISVPPVVTAAATSSAGTFVTYAVTVTDPDDPATVTCAPPSGSLFAVGATIVRCHAVDTAGNAADASFPVVVSAPGADCNLADYQTSKGLNLKNANLSGCYLPAANLSGATATNANMVGSYLVGANLTSANLSQVHLGNAVLTGANLTGVMWNHTTCPDGSDSNTDGGTCAGHLG